MSIPIDAIAKVYISSLKHSIFHVYTMHPIFILYKKLSSHDSKTKKNINKIQVQLFASKNEKKVIKEVELIKSEGIDKVYYLKMKSGYYKILIDSDDKKKFRRLLPKYNDSFLVRIEN